MTIIELREQIINLKQELSNIIANGENEKRELNEGEFSRLAEIRKAIVDNEAEIAKQEEENRNLAKTENNKQTKEIRKMPKKLKLIDAINAVVNHRAFDEDMQNEISAAKEEFRASGLDAVGDIQLRSLLHVDTGAGAEDIATEIKPIEVAVRNNLVASKMGAEWLGGLRGDVQIPRYSGSNVAWATEVAQAQDGAGTFDDLVLTPHRLTAFIDVSKQLLIQASEDIEALLLNDIAKAVAEKLDKTIFSASTGDTATPAGIFSTSATTTGATALSAVTYDNVLALEEAVELNNGHEYMFVMNPKVKFAYKGTQQASGLNMVVDGQEIDGYRFISSNSVVSKGIACLNPRSLVIGQWSGLDITVDPYTLAREAKVRLVVNAWYDWKLRNDEIATEIYA